MTTKWLGKHPVLPLATFPIIAEEPHQSCVPGSIHTISFSTIQLPRLFARSPMCSPSIQIADFFKGYPEKLYRKGS